MKPNLFNKILQDSLSYYLGLDESSLDEHITFTTTARKERIGIVNDLNVIIYSNDHNPPHFHVKSNDLKIDAKFSIEQCDLISGEISSKHLKRIKAFYNSPKGKIILEKIWNKKLLN
jgi:hypothetical protein